MPSENPADLPNETPVRADQFGMGVQPPEQHPPRRRTPINRLVRVIIRGGLALVVLLAVLVGLAPWLAGTGPGKGFIVGLVNAQLDGELTIEGLDLSWAAGQQITGVSYADPGKGLSANIASIDAPQLGLLGLLKGSRKLGTVTLKDTEVFYEKNVAEPTVPSPGKEPRHDPKPLELPPSLSGSIVVDGLAVTYKSAKADPIVLTLGSGSLDLPDIRDIAVDVEASLRQGDRSGGVVLNAGVLNLFDPDGAEQMMQAAYDIDARVTGLSPEALDEIVSGLADGVKPGTLLALLGGKDLSAGLKVRGRIQELQSELEIDSENLRVKMIQEIAGESLVASPASYATLDLKKEGGVLDVLFPEAGLELVEDTAIALRSFSFTLPTVEEGIDWGKASAALMIGADANLALRDEQGEVIGIDALTITGRAESIATQAKAVVSASLTAVDKAGRVTREPVNAQVVIDRPLDAGREVVFFSESLPIALADTLLGRDEQLVLWLGRTLALRAELRGHIEKDEAGNSRWVRSYSLEPEGRVNGRLIGEQDKERITLSTPDKAPIETTLVPEAFASLMELLSGKPGQPALTIDRPMRVYVTLRDEQRGEVAITADPSQRGVKRFYPDLERTYLGATVELSPARVYEPNSKQTYDLRGGRLMLSAPDLRGKATVAAELNLQVPEGAGKEGVASLLKWETTIGNLLASDGGVPLDGESLMQQVKLNGGVTLQNAPSMLFDALLNRDGDIASVLGPVVDQLDAGFTYADGRPTGATLKLNWDAKSNQPISGAGASLKPVAFDIDADKMLTVRGGEDIELQVRVTEAFGDRWMGQLHPILFDAKTGDRPIGIKIDGSSFRFPLDDPTMKGARVQAEVDLGSLSFGEGALIGRLLDWTGHSGARAVFEPVRVSLADGRVRYDGFAMAVGNVQLKLDGEVDLSNGQIVDMAVRVPSESLTTVFSELEGLIAPGDSLSIPMSGPIRKPQFDQRLITREVARMLTRGLIEKQTRGLGDQLFGRIRKELGVEDPPQPAPQQEGANGDEAAPPGEATPKPAVEPEAEPEPQPQRRRIEDELRDELIDRGIGLIFGGRRDRDRQEEQE